MPKKINISVTPAQLRMLEAAARWALKTNGPFRPFQRGEERALTNTLQPLKNELFKTGKEQVA
jgi:hypothetical protein